MSYQQTVNGALCHKRFLSMEQIKIRCPSVPPDDITRIIGMLERAGLVEVQRDGVRKFKGRKVRTKQLPLL